MRLRSVDIQLVVLRYIDEDNIRKLITSFKRSAFEYAAVVWGSQ